MPKQSTRSQQKRSRSENTPPCQKAEDFNNCSGAASERIGRGAAGACSPRCRCCSLRRRAEPAKKASNIATGGGQVCSCVSHTCFCRFFPGAGRRASGPSSGSAVSSAATCGASCAASCAGHQLQLHGNYGTTSQSTDRFPLFRHLESRLRLV